MEASDCVAENQEGEEHDRGTLRVSTDQQMDPQKRQIRSKTNVHSTLVPQSAPNLQNYEVATAGIDFLIVVAEALRN
jgi:hypothetical protein